MTTSFSKLPIIDLSPLQTTSLNDLPTAQAENLAHQLYDVFSTTGFAYLTNHPLSFSHQDIFSISQEFFSMPESIKLSLAKRSFNPLNTNTYRGYFPTQPFLASNNLKEGFEQGPTNPLPPSSAIEKINLAEQNLWPSPDRFSSRHHLERLHDELQSLSANLLSLLAISLGKPDTYFDHLLVNSLSTLRLLHYPANESESNQSSSTINSMDSGMSEASMVKLSCTPHTDSGILTLLHQDSTGGLEVQNANDEWIAAPYVPGSIVVNIGDLMSEVSGGRFVATMHRVRAPQGKGSGFGRFSVPFFFEPGEEAVLRSVDDENGHGIIYGEHVRSKMATWVEFQDDGDDE